LEGSPVVSKGRRAISPKNLNDVEPAQNCSAQIPPPQIFIGAELLTKAIWPEQWDLGISLQCETAPNKPKIEIRTTGRIDHCAHNVQIRRNWMLADFIPELLAESDTIRKTIIGAEVRRARENSLKSFNEPAVMLPVTRQTELPDSEGCDPDWNSLSCPNGSPKSG
jgi:hypothetical protein